MEKTKSPKTKVDYTLKIVTWRQVRTRMQTLNPGLAAAIDALPDNKDLPFVSASLPFGTQLEDGENLNVYYENELVQYNSDTIPEAIKDHLDYDWQSIPVGVSLHNTLEFHVDLPTHSVPLKVYEPGMLFALNNLFEPGQNTHVVYSAHRSTAGSKSLILLPKISHTQYNDRLKKAFGPLKNLCPKGFSQVWALLKELTEVEGFDAPWHCELLFFSKDVVEQLKQHTGANHFLMTQAWHDTAFARNHEMYDMVWTLFTEQLPNNIRHTAFILETAKHIILLAMRQIPGFSPVLSDLTGPNHRLTEIFLRIYRVRYYLPVFMRPKLYDGRNPVYYSLHQPTFFHPIPKRSNASRTIDEIETVKDLVNAFTKAVLDDQLPFSLKNTLLYTTLTEVEFEFYHPQGDKGQGLSTDIASIAKDDKRFLSMINEFDDVNPKLEFPDHSVFFNGCIRVRPKQKDPDAPSMKEFLMPLSGKKLSDDE